MLCSSICLMFCCCGFTYHSLSRTYDLECRFQVQYSVCIAGTPVPCKRSIFYIMTTLVSTYKFTGGPKHSCKNYPLSRLYHYHPFLNIPYSKYLSYTPKSKFISSRINPYPRSQSHTHYPFPFPCPFPSCLSPHSPPLPLQLQLQHLSSLLTPMV
jgi:hypothetical protein